MHLNFLFQMNMLNFFYLRYDLLLVGIPFCKKKGFQNKCFFNSFDNYILTIKKMPGFSAYIFNKQLISFLCYSTLSSLQMKMYLMMILMVKRVSLMTMKYVIFLNYFINMGGEILIM